MASTLLIKLATGVALKAANDENVRSHLLAFILTSVAIVIFLITFTFYLISNPISALSTFLDAGELDLVKGFQNDYGYSQNLSIDDPDYRLGSGQTYEGVVLGQAGETQVVYYSQLDGRWSASPYGDSTVSRSGCGPTSMSIVVSTLTGQSVEPPKMAAWAYQNGYYCSGSGSYHSLITGAARQYGLSVQGDLAAQDIVDALADGKLVVAIMAKGHFTKGGHFIVLRGVTENGKILVADPASMDRSNQQWDLSLILDEARKGAGAGGRPFLGYWE